MKKLITILLVIISFSCIANDTIKKPNVIVTTNGNFKEIPKEFITDKIYTSIDGINYPVFKSTTGKYFIKKISPKTNKEYRFYLVL
jgi:hypothetical protein